MSHDQPKTVRSWQEIAEEAAKEKDHNRLMQLSEELTRALKERDRKVKAEQPAAPKSARGESA
jgi:hypothetical protein